MQVKIDKEKLEQVKQYLLGSIIPSRDAQELHKILSDVEEIIEPKGEENGKAGA